MIDDIMIRADGLSKKYIIGHQNTDRVPTLRDTISRTATNLVRTTRDLLNGKALVTGDEVEEFWALKNVNFEIRRGDVVGIIGRNGAGKSTLLKVLSRITEPSEGRVEIRGRVASLLEVGTGFHPELTGRENIFLNGAILGMRQGEIRRKFDEIVAFAEIEKFLDTPVKRYSSGMYVRLAFAVAAHLEPEILIVDEVLAVGDAEFQKKCLGKMQNVASEGRTVLFVSHNIGAISTLCATGLILKAGNLEYFGPVDLAVSKYTESQSNINDLAFVAHDEKPSITRILVNSEALGEKMLSVSIEFSSPHPISRVIGGIVLSSSSGQPIWGTNGRFHNSINDMKEVLRGTLVCEARDIPLRSGNYMMSVWLGDWHSDYDQKIDCMSVAFGIPDDGVSLRPAANEIGHVDWPAKWMCVV